MSPTMQASVTSHGQGRAAPRRVPPQGRAGASVIENDEKVAARRRRGASAPPILGVQAGDGVAGAATNCPHNRRFQHFSK
jgi:hypothetical protein